MHDLHEMLTSHSKFLPTMLQNRRDGGDETAKGAADGTPDGATSKGSLTEFIVFPRQKVVKLRLFF